MERKVGTIFVLRSYERRFKKPKTHAMLRVTSILWLSLATSFAADAKREEFTLRATVQDVVTLSSYSGTVTPVEIAPRFAVTVRIDSIKPALSNLAVGATAAFAVHSPSRLFGTTDVKRKTCDLILRRETMDRKTRFSGLELRR